jgi:hypothetical protein
MRFLTEQDRLRISNECSQRMQDELARLRARIKLQKIKVQGKNFLKKHPKKS